MREGWENSTIGETCDLLTGGTPQSSKRSYYDGGTINWVVSGDVHKKQILDCSKKITKLGLENSNARMLPKDSVLIALNGIGKTRGTVAMLRIEATCNQSIVCMSPKDRETLSPEFLFHFLDGQYQAIRNITGDKDRRGLNMPLIRKIKIPLPTLPEQQRIVAILEEAIAGLTTATANAEKNLKNSRELFDSYLDLVFAGKGEGWVEKCLTDLIEVTHGYAFDGKYFVDGDGDYPILLTPGNFSETGALVFSERNTKRFTGEVLTNFILDEGDLVVVMTDLSSKMKILGKPAFVDRAGILHNQRIGRVVFKGAVLFAGYLYYFFRTTAFTAHIKSSATGTMVKHTAPKRILNSVIRFPVEIPEQKRITSMLDALSAQVEGLEALYRKKTLELSELKQSILKKAFSGALTAAYEGQTVTTFRAVGTNTQAASFGASILAVAYEKHRVVNRENSFGHVKAQKLLHLVEAIAEIDLGRDPIKDAAGPNDFDHMRRVEGWAEQRAFFKFHKSDGRYYFQRLQNFNKHLADARAKLQTCAQEITDIIDLLLPMNSEEAEVLATVYAAWNNLILDGKPITDDVIVHEARDAWHSDKMSIPRERFMDAIKLLKNNHLVPDGKAKRVREKYLV